MNSIRSAARVWFHVGLDNEINREDWVAAALSEVPADARLLDAGAGERQYRRHCKHLRYVSHDFAEYTGTGDRSGLQTGSWDTTGIDIVSDITAIPVDDASFDAVLCTEVLEHVPDPLAALTELARVLRPEGRLILTAPFASLTHFAPHFYSTGFSRYFFEHHLARLGFRDIGISTNGNWFEYLAQELRRLPDASVRYARIPASLPVRAATYVLLRLLARASSQDIGSDTFAPLGLHVLATRT